MQKTPSQVRFTFCTLYSKSKKIKSFSLKFVLLFSHSSFLFLGMQHSTESASFHTISSHFWQIAPALLLRNLLFPDARQDLQKFLQPELELELDFAFCFLTF